MKVTAILRNRFIHLIKIVYFYGIRWNSHVPISIID
jgi:hypothetical protein